MRTTTLFFHPEVAGPKVSRLTFAISPFRDEKGTLTLLVGLAKCSKPDVFVKKEGRVLALSKTPQHHTIHSLPKYIAEVMNQSQKEWTYSPNEFAWLSLRFL